MASRLIEDLHNLITAIPIELAMSLASRLETSESWDVFLSEYTSLVRSSHLRQLVNQVVQIARYENRTLRELSFAIQVACTVELRRRQEPILELVWSGPTFKPFVLRRTDEVILDLIRSAETHLTLVSFALYRVERLNHALKNAANRGVKIRVFVESKNITESDIRDLYGGFLSEHISFYAWSPDQRIYSNIGKFGLLHAKAAISDRRQLLISSANLTEHAMSLNIELGLLVTGSDLPQKVNQLLDQLIEKRVFISYSDRGSQ